MENIPKLPPAPAAWLVRKIAELAEGPLTLCCSHKYPLLPLELARTGQCIILLEKSPEDAALLMEKAVSMNVLTSFQIYLDSPQEMLSRSIDLYNLVVLGPQEASITGLDLLSEIRTRLLPGGILCLFGIPQKNLASCSDKIIEAGFTIERQMDFSEGHKRWIPGYIRGKAGWIAVIAKSSEKKG